MSNYVVNIKPPGIQEASGPVTTTEGQEVWLNSSSLLPPVDCPLMVEVEGVNCLVAARRTRFISKKTDNMEYQIFTGQTIHGRLRWTYP
ncbi:hypothetical protein [Marinobacter nauticus]|uniref:Uncharacterized protein n=1 Tax=Marinobacter nauticus TaxID=2743 RepID=A0A833N8W6_MARNT|nr:hypothetical protein [Marinobacter nauticus]KAE8546126.1 hypothetical protein F6453_1372 [Marinobacter nauticus]